MDIRKAFDGKADPLDLPQIESRPVAVDAPSRAEAFRRAIDRYYGYAQLNEALDRLSDADRDGSWRGPWA